MPCKNFFWFSNAWIYSNLCVTFCLSEFLLVEDAMLEVSLFLNAGYLTNIVCNEALSTVFRTASQ